MAAPPHPHDDISDISDVSDRRVGSLGVFVQADSPNDETAWDDAAHLARHLNLPLLRSPRIRDVDAILTITPDRLELRMIGGDPLTRGGHALYADFSKLDVVSNVGKSIRQPIGKAIGLKKASDPRPTVIDCTAGWGEDSWLLAGLSCRVLSVERNRVIAELLRDGLQRASKIHPWIASRITLIEDNAVDLLRRVDDPTSFQQWAKEGNVQLPDDFEELIQPDVVFLDPMFPIRRKGAEGKPMKVLRQLVGDDSDASNLLDAARSVAKRRVVVKRPLHGEPIGGESPAVSHKGKSVRYDVYPNV